MITKQPGRPGKVLVTFSMPAALWADTIHLVGDFNEWNETATPLRQAETGWAVALELDTGRSYRYRYLLNGSEWHNDWQADRYETNVYGGDDSVVETPEFFEFGAARAVGDPPPTLHTSFRVPRPRHLRSSLRS